LDPFSFETHDIILKLMNRSCKGGAEGPSLPKFHQWQSWTSTTSNCADGLGSSWSSTQLAKHDGWSRKTLEQNWLKK
jgi:hypothetical protein